MQVRSTSTGFKGLLGFSFFFFFFNAVVPESLLIYMPLVAKSNQLKSICISIIKVVSFHRSACFSKSAGVELTINFWVCPRASMRSSSPDHHQLWPLAPLFGQFAGFHGRLAQPWKKKKKGYPKIWRLMIKINIFLKLLKKKILFPNWEQNTKKWKTLLGELK